MKEFQVNPFKSWKMIVLKCSTQMPANLENSAVDTGLEMVSFHSNPKEGQCQIMFKLSYNWPYFTSSKVAIKILQEMGILYHLTCCLRTLYAGQEAIVRTGLGTTDWFQIRKGVLKAVYCYLLIYLIYRVHHAKCQAQWNTSWNKDCWEKYQ